MKLTSILINTLVLSISLSAYAQNEGGDKLDIQKLEQKYWSAKDDDFAVVQNRRYSKANRYFATVSTGLPFNDIFSTGSLNALNVGYYFSERWGLELSMNQANFSNNTVVNEFITRYATMPDHNKFKSSQIISMNYVPLYAKMSLLDKTIIYFDMGFSLGVGQADYTIIKQEGNENKTSPSYQWSINQQIFFSEHFAIRLDVVNKYTNQQKLKYSTSATERDQGTKVFNDSSVLLGITYWH